MKNKEVSLRGKLVRDMMKNMMDSAMSQDPDRGIPDGPEGTCMDLSAGL